MAPSDATVPLSCGARAMGQAGGDAAAETVGAKRKLGLPSGAHAGGRRMERRLLGGIVGQSAGNSAHIPRKRTRTSPITTRPDRSVADTAGDISARSISD
jgi:hypothetical protein